MSHECRHCKLIIKFIYVAIGMSMSMSGFSLATNSYFTTKRGRAIGMAMTLIALGPILMPQIATILLSFYGIQVYCINYVFIKKRRNFSKQRLQQIKQI